MKSVNIALCCIFSMISSSVLGAEFEDGEQLVRDLRPEVITERTVAHSSNDELELDAPITRLAIPEIARGYEDLYTRFLRGILIYKPNKENDIGRIELPISSLLNPLESTFDLSRCGDTGQYLSISTGYRKGKIAANASKAEVWIVPKFVVEREVGSTARHYRDIMSKWTAPYGLFYSWGGYEDLTSYDFLVTASPEEIIIKTRLIPETTQHIAARRAFIFNFN